MAKFTGTVLVMFALLCISLAAAAPCIECKDCQGLQSCYKQCQKTCPSQPQQVQVNGRACESFGFNIAGPPAAQKACELTMKFCEGGVQQSNQALGMFKVDLSQCANIAFGTCQNRAMDRWRSPCGWHFNGFKQCSGQQFREFYNGIVSDSCRNAVRAIQNL